MISKAEAIEQLKAIAQRAGITDIEDMTLPCKTDVRFKWTHGIRKGKTGIGNVYSILEDIETGRW